MPIAVRITAVENLRNHARAALKFASRAAGLRRCHAHAMNE
jgi:hypothetical protein